MKFLLIPDKFKGSLDAEEVIRAISDGLYGVFPDAEIHSALVSDGGDGFLGAVSKKLDVAEISVNTVDPLGRALQALYLFNRSTRTAYIELAKASGLELLKDGERDVMHTSTYGTGLQIRDALEKGATRIYLGLGGSATNDAGMGIAKALGYRFLDPSGNELAPVGDNLGKIAAIEKPGVVKIGGKVGFQGDTVRFDTDKIQFFAVNDVDNPLYGPQGAAYVYAEQKGANPQEVELLDAGLRHLDRIVTGGLGKNAANTPGAGAAGGTAYGLQVFLNAEFLPGVTFVLQLAQVEQLLTEKNFDFIITGEGKFDQQTLHGKLIKGVRDVGMCHGVPVIVICGMLDVDPKSLRNFGLEEVLEIRDTSKSLPYNMQHAARLIQESIYRYFNNH
ncbi:MAG TPA: glycerate kinase [Pricia sp.]|nr:glycerate kinase [Pricia sp.]